MKNEERWVGRIQVVAVRPGETVDLEEVGVIRGLPQWSEALGAFLCVITRPPRGRKPRTGARHRPLTYLTGPEEEIFTPGQGVHIP